MTTRNKTQTKGALAPQKEKLFSINVVEKGALIRLVNNAPPQEQEIGWEIGRTRAD